jgi:hypothetical protein
MTPILQGFQHSPATTLRIMHNLALHFTQKNREKKRFSGTTKECEEILARPNPSYAVAAHHVHRAIESLRRIGDTKVRRDALHRQLLEYQEQSTKEMISHSHQLDISNIVGESIKRVEGKSLREGLLALAFASSPQSVVKLHAGALETLKRSLGAFLFLKVIVDGKGRTVARPQGPLSTKPEESEGAIRGEMVFATGICRNVVVQGVIEPIRSKLCADHDVRLHHFFEIVGDNPLIPQGREYIVARGLYAGMRGDFLVASHLLIPQFEESIRYVLAQHGIITSGLDNDGIQNENDLNTLLYKSEVTTIFGEDTAFDLKSLLVDHAGANLRNRLAHGLMHSDEFYAADTIYFWWIFLRLCCVQMKQRQVEQ